MNATLSNEVFWLVLTLLMTALFWVPYILNRMLEQGVWNALRDPQGETGTARHWARRMMKAHDNAVENLVIFGPLVILVELTGVHSQATATACMVYFFARLVHYTVFTFAVPVLRVVAFLAGFGAQLVLLRALLGIG
jgi:uncharacterized MAPEG superfamily protein